MRLMSMATCLPSSRCPVVFIKAVPCPPCYMFSMLKFLPVISVPTPPSRASSCQGSQSPFQSSPSMQMVRLWLRCLTRLSLRFLPPTRFLKRVNLGKCKGLWLGPWRDRQDPPVDLQWSSDKIKVLGLYIGPGVSDEDNWRPRISAVENVLNSWCQRSLSLNGRALIVNSLALSRIWYVASLVHMPDSVLRELNTAL